jgi:dTDP-glucose 4,6-dehydratase
MRLLITGGAGFIGSAVVRSLIAESDWTVLNVDKLTYAGSLDAVASVADDPRYQFIKVDICQADAMRRIVEEFRPQAILHLAAESHVDRSLDGPAPFVETNIVGTYTLLEVALAYWRGLGGEDRARFRFHHVSTDEVFGSAAGDEAFNEASPYRPNSPYSASKAAADHLVRAWHMSFGLPVVLSNCSNNYGPYQHPEKLIPTMVRSAAEGRPLPVYGKGENVRDWLHVDDHARALATILSQGRVGESYNVGARCQRSNLDVVRLICSFMDELAPDSPHRPHEGLITFVTDRPGHDLRYAIDPTKIETELGWRPAGSFEPGLRKTVAWYLDNEQWGGRVSGDQAPDRRRGLARVSGA